MSFCKQFDQGSTGTASCSANVPYIDVLGSTKTAAVRPGTESLLLSVAAVASLRTGSTEFRCTSCNSSACAPAQVHCTFHQFQTPSCRCSRSGKKNVYGIPAGQLQSYCRGVALQTTTILLKAGSFVPPLWPISSALTISIAITPGACKVSSSLREFDCHPSLLDTVECPREDMQPTEREVVQCILGVRL